MGKYVPFARARKGKKMRALVVYMLMKGSLGQSV